MIKKEIITLNAPGCQGPSSQAIACGPLLFCSGQLPLNPVSGKMGQNIAQMTTFVLKNLKAVLAQHGMTMNEIVKTTVYLTDLAAFNEMDAVYAAFFVPPYPARSIVQVAALPQGAALAIDCIAIHNDSHT